MRANKTPSRSFTSSSDRAQPESRIAIAPPVIRPPRVTATDAGRFAAPQPKCNCSIRADPRSWDSGAMRWFGQASEHDADHGETDESGGGSCIALEVARQAAVSTDPGEGAFDDPALGKNDEAMQLVSLDDFQRPGAGLCDGCGRLRSLVAGVGEDVLDEGKEAARTLVKNQSRAIAILHS